MVKNLPANAKRRRFDSCLSKIPREGKGYPLQYSCLGNPMDRGAWRAIVMGSQKCQMWLSDYTATTTALVNSRTHTFTSNGSCYRVAGTFETTVPGGPGSNLDTVTLPGFGVIIRA